MYSNTSSSLFFSSNSHFNMGGFDIFYSKFEDGKWKVPLNIGYPINDTHDNMWFCPSFVSREGYCVFPNEEENGQDDIFLIKIVSESVLNFDRKK